MERRPIPGTTVQVPVLCLGTMTFGTPVGEPEAAALVDRALDLGIDFIDTANSYEGYARYPGSPGGVAEEFLGRVLVGRRPRALIATKVGMKIGPDAADEGLNPAHLKRECDRSLRRLQSEWIDLYYLHRPDPSTPLHETAETMAGLIRAGKVRMWGLSNFDAAQVRQVLSVCDAGGWPRPSVLQPAYSLLRPEAGEELVPLCRTQGLAVVPYRVLEGGILSGKYRTGSLPPAGSRAADRPDWVPLLADEEMMSRLREIERQAAGAGLDLFAYALRTTLSVPGITSLILGVTRPEQLEAAVRALD